MTGVGTGVLSRKTHYFGSYGRLSPIIEFSRYYASELGATSFEASASVIPIVVLQSPRLCVRCYRFFLVVPGFCSNLAHTISIGVTHLLSVWQGSFCCNRVWSVFNNFCFCSAF